MEDVRYFEMNQQKQQQQQYGRKTRKGGGGGDGGIGRVACFAFRPPRTITTSDMSVDEASQPSDEGNAVAGKRSSLKSPVSSGGGSSINRTWTITSDGETTANLTSVQSSYNSPDTGGYTSGGGGGYMSSGGDSSSLLSMPTPTDRSHRRRLQMERGGGRVHKYDGEQEPAGFRGQEAATPKQSKPPKEKLGRRGKKSPFNGNVDPSGYQESPEAPPRAVSSNLLLAMPTPTDRSHIRRLKMERDGKSNAYAGEQEPAGYRGQEAATTPEALASSMALPTSSSKGSFKIMAMPTPKDRSHVRRLNLDDDDEPPGTYRSTSVKSSNAQVNHLLMLPTPTDQRKKKQVEREDEKNSAMSRTPTPKSRRRRDPSPSRDVIPGLPEAVNNSFQRADSPTKGTGSPYLQFSIDGPALRVFETSPRRLESPNTSLMEQTPPATERTVEPSSPMMERSIGPNSSLMSVESDDEIRWMVKDLVPLSASAEKKIKNRVAGYSQRSPAANIKPKPILKTPTRRRQIHETSIWSASGQPVTGGDPESPERSALRTIRVSPAGAGTASVSSASTCSSVALQNMMNDFVVDDAGPAARSPPMTNVNEMAASAQSHVEEGEYDLALVLFGRILAIYRRVHGDIHPLVASAYHNLGIVHSQRGSLLLEGTLQQQHVRQQSLQCFQAAARTARDSLGKNHPNVAVSLVKIGFLLLQARQYEPALVTFEEALRIRLVAFGANPNQLTANLYNNLGICLLHLQKFEESKRNLNKALDIQRHMLRAERKGCTREDLRVRLLEVADTLSNLGGLGLEWLRQEGPQHEVMWEAESQLAEAMEIRTTVLGYNHPLAHQAKSLHDMIRSTAPLVDAPTSDTDHLTPSSAKSQLSEMSHIDEDQSSFSRTFLEPPSYARTKSRDSPPSADQNFEDAMSRSLQKPLQPPSSVRPRSSVSPGQDFQGSTSRSSQKSLQPPSSARPRFSEEPPSTDLESTPHSPRMPLQPPSSLRSRFGEGAHSPDQETQPRSLNQPHISVRRRVSESSATTDQDSDDTFARSRQMLLQPPAPVVAQIKSPHAADEDYYGSFSAMNISAYAADEDCYDTASPSMYKSNITPSKAPTPKVRALAAAYEKSLSPSRDAPAPKAVRKVKEIYANGKDFYSSFSPPPNKTVRKKACDPPTPRFRLPVTLPETPQNTSRDAPAPVALSPPPVVELEGQGAPFDEDAASPVSRNVSVDSTRAPRGRVISSTPPVTEVVLSEEDDVFQNRRKSPERTKIYVSPHYVPRKSPTRRKSGAANESYYSDPSAPALMSSSGSESSDQLQSRNRAYDTEESCLLNESGDRVDLLSRFLVQAGETVEDEMNLSSHEIMIVRPSTSSAMAPNTPGSLVQPLAQAVNGSWKGDSNKKKASTLLSGGKDNDDTDGIAPLCRSEKNKRTQQKVHLSQDMLENPDPHVADIYAAASRYLKKNRLLEAKHLFITVLDCQRKAHGELHEDVGAALHNVGLVLLRANEYGESLAYFERAVRVRKGSLGREHPEVAVSQVKVGITLLLMHSFDMALQAFVEALSIRKRALGDLHPSNAVIYCNIGCVHVEFNELRDARRAFEAALDIQRNALYHEPDSGPLMFGTATTLCNLGYLYRYREMHQKVAMVLKEALSLQEGVLGPTHPTVVTTMDSLADALSMSGGCSQSLRYYNEILSRLEFVVEISNRRQAEAVILYKMSRAHRKQNDAEAEVDKLKKALEAIRATGVSTVSEKTRKEQLERHILADIRRSREELEKMQLEWI